MKTLLFLCTGNYYRSRFAEILFNWYAGRRGLRWQAQSRGLALYPWNVGAISRHTIARLTEHGITLDSSQRLPLDAQLEDFTAADHIVAVKRTEHRPLIESRFPAWLERVEFWEVHDVDFAEPVDALPHLEREVFGLLGRLAG